MQSANAISAQLNDFYRKPYTVVSLELFLTIGLVIFLAAGVIKPTLTTMSGLSKEITEKKELTQKLEKKSASLATAQAMYYANQEKLSLLDQAIPKKESVITDLKTIERMAGENSLVITSLGMQAFQDPSDAGKSNAVASTQTATASATTTPTKQQLPISLSVEGDYLSIRDFVDQLITYRRLYIINQVVFSIKKQQLGQSLSAMFTIETPYAE